MEEFGNLRLKTFDGTSDVREFIKRFNIVTAAKELNDDQKAAWVPVSSILNWTCYGALRYFS